MSLNEAFTEIFGTLQNPTFFGTLSDVHNAVSNYQNRTGTSYSIRSTQPSVSDARWRCYACVKKGRPLRSTQPRRQRISGQTGCSSQIRFARTDSGSFALRNSILEHNHPVSVLLGRFEPKHRRLNDEEIPVIRPWLLNNTPSFNICSFVRSEFGKMLTTKDVCNLRAKYTGIPSNEASLDDLSTQLNGCGHCRILRDAANVLTHFIFMTREQVVIFRRFPQFVGIDSTYRSCREKYHLFVLVAVDSCGVGIPVCFGWLATETTSSIGLFLRCFLEFVGPVEIEALMMDDSTAIQAAVAQELPDAHRFLCRVHILRNLSRRVSLFYVNRLLLKHPTNEFTKWFYVAMCTRSMWKYLLALVTMRRTDERVYNTYVRPRLISRSHMWTSIRSPPVATFGRRDNNFVEATHFSIKRYNLDGKINLWQAVERTR